MSTAKQTNYQELAKEAHRPVVFARIDRLVNSPATHIKAYATVNLGGAYAVHGVRVIDSQNGLFVQMPQNSFQRDGKLTYQDVFHPVSAKARKELCAGVLKAYEQKLSEEAAQTASRQDEDYPELTGIDPDDPFSLGNEPNPLAMSM